MRTNLRAHNGKRYPFQAKVGRFGTKSGWKGYEKPTICFVEVKFMDGKEATDHIWMTVGKQISDLGLKEGDTVQFEARIADYVKGFVSERQGIDERTLDYKLNNITKIRRV